MQGVQIDAKGNIIVDEFQNTSAKNIYALGDVCGRALLTPGKLGWKGAMFKVERSGVLQTIRDPWTGPCNLDKISGYMAFFVLNLGNSQSGIEEICWDGKGVVFS